MDMSFQCDQQQLDLARMRFADGERVPETLLPGTLSRSWERSRHAGLMPWQAPNYQDRQRFNPRDDPDDRRLAQCVAGEIEQLWGAFGGRDWTVFCVNRKGTIVHQRQHCDADPRLLRPLQVGCRIQEGDIGTTAPACTLAEDTPAVVRGNQHYLCAFGSMFCLSVPLHGLEGELLGALDITGIGDRDAQLLLGYFRQAALAAENRLFGGLRDCYLLALQHDPRWLDSPMQGVLAVDAAGGVHAANRVARRLLGLPRTGALDELTLDHLFESSTRAQRRRLLQAGPPRRVPWTNGVHGHVQLIRSPRGKHLGARSTSAHPALRDQALHAVADAWRENAGNVSATARQLGISRTTLYRKLDALQLRPAAS